MNTAPPTSDWIQVARSLAVEKTPPAAEAYEGVLASVVVGLECSGPGRGLDVGWVILVYQGKGEAAVHVAVRVGIRKSVRGAGGERGVVHAQWPEQSFLKDTGQRLPVLALLDDEAEQRVVGVGVMIGRCTSEQSWQTALERDDRIRPALPRKSGSMVTTSLLHALTAKVRSYSVIMTFTPDNPCLANLLLT
ncbi:MAG TPA: hypothetical protein VFO40_02515 [Chthoniobacterales bacterium]|nr:hypothetical protein [Chthoniobacterales bacterium]